MTISESLQKLEALERALREVLGCDEQQSRLWAAQALSKMGTLNVDELPQSRQDMLELFSGETARLPKQ